MGMKHRGSSLHRRQVESLAKDQRSLYNKGRAESHGFSVNHFKRYSSPWSGRFTICPICFSRTDFKIKLQSKQIKHSINSTVLINIVSENLLCLFPYPHHHLGVLIMFCLKIVSCFLWLRKTCRNSAASKSFYKSTQGQRDINSKYFSWIKMQQEGCVGAHL
jgi:hypothetical protein